MLTEKSSSVHKIYDFDRAWISTQEKVLDKYPWEVYDLDTSRGYFKQEKGRPLHGLLLP